MNLCRRRLSLLVLAGLFGLTGASCPQFLQQYTYQPPRLLPAQPALPTLQQVMAVVDQNNARIQSFLANNATVGGPDFPNLRASVAFQRPRRFRLRAETGLTGPELDLGSNDEMFWFWVRREQPPTLYYCRHDQYAFSPARHTLPIQPEWLIEAMGIAPFDPALPQQGPYPPPNDRLEIRTVRDTPEGPTTKITILDGSQGWILEQRILDSRGQLLARSMSGNHRRDPLTGLVMPSVVQVDCPPARFSMRIDLGNVEINPRLDDRGGLWTMPRYPNVRLVNLADPNAMNLQPIPAPQPVAVPQPAASGQFQAPPAQWRPR